MKGRKLARLTMARTRARVTTSAAIGLKAGFRLAALTVLLAGIWIESGAQSLVPVDLMRQDTVSKPTWRIEVAAGLPSSKTMPYYLHALRGGAVMADSRFPYGSGRLAELNEGRQVLSDAGLNVPYPAAFGNAMAGPEGAASTLLMRTYVHVPFRSAGPKGGGVETQRRRWLDRELLIDGFVRMSPSPTAVASQAYLALRGGPFELKGGRFHETMHVQLTPLSSGSVGFSGNAVPIPQIQAGIPEWTRLPGSFGYIHIKGSLSHGWLNAERPIQSSFLHKKIGLARVGGDLPVNIVGGMHHIAFWGGHDPNFGDYPAGWSDYMKVFWVSGGSEDGPWGEDNYFLGDHRGYYDFGFYVKPRGWDLHLYRHFLLEDKDGVKFKTMQDGVLGLSGVRRARPGSGSGSGAAEGTGARAGAGAGSESIIERFTYEYIYSKYQNGNDEPTVERSNSDGWDDYYSNYRYLEGWTYFGYTIGNPLFFSFFSPAVRGMDIRLNDDRLMANNRLVAHHIGLEGVLPFARGGSGTRYRLLATWSRNYGTYRGADRHRLAGVPYRFENGRSQLSVLLETDVALGRNRGTMDPPSMKAWDDLGASLLVSIAADVGSLYENAAGVLLTLRVEGRR
jgi:hypothetical protein